MKKFADIPSLKKLMESKLARRFKVRRVTPSDLTYLIEHIYGEKKAHRLKNMNFSYQRKKAKIRNAGETL